MKIDSFIDSLRTPPVNQPTAPRPAQEVSQVPAVRPARSDSVQISDAGRRLNTEQRAAIEPDRVAELRQRALSGAYSTLDVVDQVARRILTRGDL